MSSTTASIQPSRPGRRALEANRRAVGGGARPACLQRFGPSTRSALARGPKSGSSATRATQGCVNDDHEKAAQAAFSSAGVTRSTASGIRYPHRVQRRRLRESSPCRCRTSSARMAAGRRQADRLPCRADTRPRSEPDVPRRRRRRRLRPQTSPCSDGSGVQTRGHSPFGEERQVPTANGGTMRGMHGDHDQGDAHVSGGADRRLLALSLALLLGFMVAEVVFGILASSLALSPTPVTCSPTLRLALAYWRPRWRPDRPRAGGRSDSAASRFSRRRPTGSRSCSSGSGSSTRRSAD